MFTLLLLEFRSPPRSTETSPRSPGLLISEVLTLEARSEDLVRSVAVALLFTFEELRSEVEGRLVVDFEVLGLEVDLLYPPFTEGLVDGIVVVGFELGRLEGLLCRVEGLLLGAGRLEGLDIVLLELLWLMR